MFITFFLKFSPDEYFRVNFIFDGLKSGLVLVKTRVIIEKMVE